MDIFEQLTHSSLYLRLKTRFRISATSTSFASGFFKCASQPAVRDFSTSFRLEDHLASEKGGMGVVSGHFTADVETFLHIFSPDS